MIKNFIPGFNFINPDIRLLDVRMGSINVIGETRRIRTIWTPELTQDLMTFQNIDAEAELTALFAENLRNEIDQRIIQDIHDNGRFYDNDRLRDIFTIRDTFINPRTITTWFDLMPNPLRRVTYNYDTELRNDWITPLFTPPEPNYTVLPNEDGWFMDGVFESLLIKMEMKPYKFLRRRNRRTDIRRLCGL